MHTIHICHVNQSEILNGNYKNAKVKKMSIIKSTRTNPRYDNVTLSPLLLTARVTNRSDSTYGSSARSDSHRAVLCPNSVVSGWEN